MPIITQYFMKCKYILITGHDNWHIGIYTYTHTYIYVAETITEK